MSLAEEALACCLTHLPYHPILWTLYSVSSHLNSYRPILDGERHVVVLCIDDVIVNDEHFFVQNPDKAVNGFYIFEELCYMKFDKREEKEKKHRFYQIPKAWIPRLFMQHNTWFLYEQKFCCRLNFTRHNDFCLLVEQDICLDGVDIFPELYHIGFGYCNDRRKSRFLNDCGLNFGWSKIFKYIKNVNGVNELNLSRTRMMSALQGLDDEGYFILNHVVLCCECCKYLEKLLNMIVVKHGRKRPRNVDFNLTEKCWVFYQDSIFRNFISEIPCHDVIMYLRKKSVFSKTIKSR